MGKYGKKNHVSLSVLDVSLILMGTPKIGKTTLLKEVYEKVAGEDGYMFLEMYREKGASKIEGINYENVPTWEVFDEIVTDIEENREDYKDLKVVVFDTWDNAIALAEIEAIRIWNKKNPDEKKDSISAIYGGWQRGQDKAADLLEEMVFRLEQVGIKVAYILHVKNKDVTDAYTEKTYQMLTSDVMQKYFNRLKRNIDLIAVAYMDRTIITEKTGKKDLKGKEITKGVLKDEVRKIKFRDSNYAIDAGGRLKYIVEECPFEADAFINSIEDALKKEVEKGGVSLEERKKEDSQNELEENKKALQRSKAAKENKVDEERNAEIIEQIKTILLGEETSDEIKTLIRTYRTENNIDFKDPAATPTKLLEDLLKKIKT